MVEVTIDSIRVSLVSPQRVITLKDIDNERFLPIYIGPFEAEAITIKLQGCRLYPEGARRPASRIRFTVAGGISTDSKLRTLARVFTTW